MEWKWSKANEKALAQFVSDRAIELLPKLSVNSFDQVQTRDGRLHLVQSIYDQLLKQGIQYSYEKYHPEAEIQRIRTPAEILNTPGEGTCLDLALLFCGLCFGYDLLPLLIVIEGHALAAVALNHPRREWNSFARERTLFNSTELFRGEANHIALRQLVKDGAYVAVECTGFAQTQSFTGSMPEEIARTPAGTLTFERAIAAGQEQLQNSARSFQFAIDIAVAHYVWKIEPDSLAQMAVSLRLGKLMVYLSQSIQTESIDVQPSAQTDSTKLGSNPYKGLLAFQETDGDCFFGRERQITELWNKLRDLYESDSTVRLLPIYGPSGSGKSSLARAGLIPEVARRSIPGYSQARIAVLVPGTHPLESLATVLARIATDDLTPVAKTREFVGELKQVNETDEQDGLRRIADVLPDIAISPLLVLVDQFEEIYTLCETQLERDAFVNNLLCAVSDRSQRVTVIITLRSDFLGETQKHSVLNRLFSEQGYLVPSMNEAELREAICKPAELAGHPLDEATVDLLIKDTEGREGALPLLQFTLTRIWDGLIEGNQPVDTLKAIGGVGGALAGEAQRIYDTLRPEEQEIARRVFLGLVQLGEGTKDTRRRAPIDGLISYREQPEQVKRVISRFTNPGVRLITLSIEGSVETAEVTHEALFKHWQKLQQWVDSSRSDIRFQRRLDEAARYWDDYVRPDGNLWRSPDLDLLRRYQQRAGDSMTPLQVEFFVASRNLEQSWKRKEEQQQQLVMSLYPGLIFSS